MKDSRTHVLDRTELQDLLGIKGFAGRVAAGCLYRALNLDGFNRIQEKYISLTGAPFAASVLDEIGVRYHIPEHQLDRIPSEGAFIIVCNHPYGSLDGLILETLVGARRPDLKVLTTFMLTLIPGLSDSFIPVDNFSTGAARSLNGLRAALEHLSGGHPLALFPAGEVSTWQKKKNRTALGKGRIVEDIPWADSVIKLVKNSGLPVIPMYFQGGNSKLFHRLGRIHPRLRTLRLPREMFNKNGSLVEVRIGQAIQPDDFASLDVPSLGRYLRNRCYALESQCVPEPDLSQRTFPSPLAEPVPAERIREEMESLPADRILFEDGDYRVCLLRVTDAPETMQELFRLREEVFRGVGEGTGRPIDTDPYDSYYYQLILWNLPNREIAGAYRLGDCARMMAEHGGIPGLYTASLYDYKDTAAPLLSRCMELGRSFVACKYQREVHPLRLLLAGLSVATLRIPHAEYCLGPVSISNDYPLFIKSLAVHFLSREFSLPDAEQIVTPPHPFQADFLSVDPDALLQTVPAGDMDRFDRLLATVSDGKYRLPVLVRKYFSCSARLLCFNVDPDFTDSLDGLILLRLKDFPPQTLRSILRGVPAGLRDEVFMHFYGTTEP